ncbi:MAG: TlpA family protein disulfide reductase [Eubacterium sp.]|nr:TlpA family protein disulfide reductase [Eubacterium sp.]
MKSKNKWLKAIGVLLILSTLVAGCGKSTADASQANPAGADAGAFSAETNTDEDGTADPIAANKMPAFNAKDLDGNTVTESIFGAKDLTVVNIWGTFCNPCIREMPELGEWEKEMPDNVQLVGLVIDIAGDDDSEHHDLAVDITQKAGADFTQIIANQDFATILSDVYGVPTTMFVDKDGNIVGDPIIGADVDGYKTFVEDYLDGQ